VSLLPDGSGAHGFRESVADALGTRDLRRLQLAWAVSSVGGWAFFVALAVYAYDAGGAAAVGAATLVRMVPAGLAAPLTGLLADRHSRRDVLLGATAGRAVVLAGLAAAVALDAPLGVVLVLGALFTIVATAHKPGKVLLQTVSDPASADYERLRENLERLRGATDARGRTLEVTELDVLPTTEVRGLPGCVPYLNLYAVNGAVIVPVCGDDPDRDDEVLRLIDSVFEGREAVPVPGRTLAEGGGGVHCITQQVPVA
jgi:hypothetical protein